jgi:hypothetical protein
MRWFIWFCAIGVVIGIMAWKLCFPEHGALTAAPSLLTQWEEAVYSLDENEDIRFVPPPFTPQRSAGFVASAFRGAPRPQMRVMFRVIGGRIAYTAASTGTGTVDSAFRWCTHTYRSPNLELPQELALLPADGDWVVRQESSLEKRMKALESILSEVTGRRIVIERPLVEREVIIASGKWNFHPSSEPSATRFYTSTHDMRNGGMGTLADSFVTLERDLGRKIIDETEEPRPAQVYWVGRSYYTPDLDHAWRAELLASLEKQTSLKFVQTRRVVPIWIVSEKGQRE